MYKSNVQVLIVLMYGSCDTSLPHSHDTQLPYLRPALTEAHTERAAEGHHPTQDAPTPLHPAWTQG